MKNNTNIRLSFFYKQLSTLFIKGLFFLRFNKNNWPKISLIIQSDTCMFWILIIPFFWCNILSTFIVRQPWRYFFNILQRGSGGASVLHAIDLRGFSFCSDLILDFFSVALLQGTIPNTFHKSQRKI